MSDAKIMRVLPLTFSSSEVSIMQAALETIIEDLEAGLNFKEDKELNKGNKLEVQLMLKVARSALAKITKVREEESKIVDEEDSQTS